MLTTQERQAILDALTEQRGQLLRRAQEGLSFSMNRERSVGRDSIDESMEEELFSTELRLRDRETFLLAKIDQALSRLNDERIDRCEDCDDSIGFKRLLARPMTTLCIACKQDREESEEQAPLVDSGDDTVGLGIALEE